MKDQLPPRPAGRASTVVAVVLALVAVGLGTVALQAPEVFDPVRARLGTLPRPKPAPADAGLPPEVARDAGPRQAPGDVGAQLPASAGPALDAGARAPAEPAPARPTRRKKRR